MVLNSAMDEKSNQVEEKNSAMSRSLVMSVLSRALTDIRGG